MVLSLLTRKKNERERNDTLIARGLNIFRKVFFVIFNIDLLADFVAATIFFQKKKTAYVFTCPTKMTNINTF